MTFAQALALARSDKPPVRLWRQPNGLWAATHNENVLVRWGPTYTAAVFRMFGR